MGHVANAVPDPGHVSVNLRAEDLEMLLRLRDAGVIRLDGLPLANHDKRLTAWTYDEFTRDMTARQHLRARKIDGRDSTAACRARYVRFMETHPHAPVQLRPPNEASWVDHVQYRLEAEQATGAALNQERKALLSLLAFLGVDAWPSLRSSFKEAGAAWTLPPDHVLPRFWVSDDHHDDQYVAATLAYMLHYGFHVGVRPPSEICSLGAEDVDFEGRKITVTETKKGGRRRTLHNVEPFVMTGRNAKSLANYYDHVRPMVEKRGSSSFFLDVDGGAWHPNRLGQLLSEAGKRVWAPFVPYTMRRWCLTMRLVAWDLNVYRVARWAGDTVATIERHYLDHARALARSERAPGLRRVLGRDGKI